MAATENREDEYLWEMDYREGVKSDFVIVYDEDPFNALGSVRNPKTLKCGLGAVQVRCSRRPSKEGDSVMAERYVLSDGAWAVVVDLFTTVHVRGRPRSSDRLMLDGVLWCSAQQQPGEICPSDSGLGRLSITASKSGETAESSIRCSDDCTSDSMTKT